MEFYSQDDLVAVAAQLRRTLWRIGLPSLVFLAALVASLWMRVQWATVLITVLWGTVTIFFWGMKVTPLRAYRRYLRELFAGLRRNAQGAVVSFGQDDTYKDGVHFSTLIINTDPGMDAEGERLFYVDRCKPRPPLEAGDSVRITANGNFVTAWEK